MADNVTKQATAVLGYLLQVGTVSSVGAYTFQEAVQLAPAALRSEMLTPASNNVGARLRCAFWLAVGALVQRGRRSFVPTSILAPDKLYAAAVANWFAAVVMAGQSASYYTGAGALSQWASTAIGAQIRSASAEDIAEVYRQSIEIAQSNGAGQVAAQLSRLLQEPIPEDRSGLPAPPAPPNPGGWLVTVIAIAAAGAGLWYVGPAALLAGITATFKRR